MNGRAKERFLLFRLAGRMFALESRWIVAIEEARGALGGQGKDAGVSARYWWRGRSLPLLAPHLDLGLPAPRVGARSALVLLRQEQGSAPEQALLVDSVSHDEPFPRDARRLRVGRSYLRRLTKWVPLLDSTWLRGLPGGPEWKGYDLVGLAERGDETVERQSLLDVSPLEPDQFIHLSSCLDQPFKLDARGERCEAVPNV